MLLPSLFSITNVHDLVASSAKRWTANKIISHVIDQFVSVCSLHFEWYAVFLCLFSCWTDEEKREKGKTNKNTSEKERKKGFFMHAFFIWSNEICTTIIHTHKYYRLVFYLSTTWIHRRRKKNPSRCCSFSFSITHLLYLQIVNGAKNVEKIRFLKRVTRVCDGMFVVDFVSSSSFFSQFCLRLLNLSNRWSERRRRRRRRKQTDKRKIASSHKFVGHRILQQKTQVKHTSWLPNLYFIRQPSRMSFNM